MAMILVMTLLLHIRTFMEQSSPVLVGYMSTSKPEGSQVLNLQCDALIAAGIKPECLYQDRASGTRDDRPRLETYLNALRNGDLFVTWKLDRPGRDLRHPVNLVHDLTGKA